MSWSIEEHIGECRPWPAQVVVYRGETDECLAYVSGEVADRLQAENDRLRELVRILKNCADECGDCDTCPINGEPGMLNPWLGCDSLRDRMRELGVEVDG